MTDEEFEEAVGEALDLIPDELARLMSNVAVLVEDEPPADEPDLLGLYEGVPLTERDGWWDAGIAAGPDHHLQGPADAALRHP